jgi:hypothetical protein
MRTRTLRLARETLAPLHTTELASVGGGSGALCYRASDLTLCVDCVNDVTFEMCPTPTLPIEACV